MAFDLHYHMEGDGTAESPAVLSFTFTTTPKKTKSLQADLPSTVTVEVAPGAPTETIQGNEYAWSFVVRAKDPAMSRSDLFRIFDKLKSDKSWVGKHEA
jgi:hypothetical protein